MTDKRARDLLRNHFHLLTGDLHRETRDAVRHAFRAIIDRALLCDAIYAYNACGQEHANRVRDSARRHMQGLS